MFVPYYFATDGNILVDEKGIFSAPVTGIYRFEVDLSLKPYSSSSSYTSYYKIEAYVGSNKGICYK